LPPFPASCTSIKSAVTLMERTMSRAFCAQRGRQGGREESGNRAAGRGDE
jgi:hypothetical protein